MNTEDDAKMFQWLCERARVEGRDGGMSSFYSLPNIPKSDCGWVGHYPAYYHETFREAVKKAMENE